MHPMLNTAVKAARRAGAIINRASLNGGFEVQSKRANDFLTEVDKAAEAALSGIVQQAYPAHAILAAVLRRDRTGGIVPSASFWRALRIRVLNCKRQR